MTDQIITVTDDKIPTTFEALNVGEVFIIKDMDGNSYPYIKTEEGAQKFGVIFATSFASGCPCYKAKKITVEY